MSLTRSPVWPTKKNFRLSWVKISTTFTKSYGYQTKVKSLASSAEICLKSTNSVRKVSSLSSLSRISWILKPSQRILLSSKWLMHFWNTCTVSSMISCHLSCKTLLTNRAGLTSSQKTSWRISTITLLKFTCSWVKLKAKPCYLYLHISWIPPTLLPIKTKLMFSKDLSLLGQSKSRTCSN